MTLDNASLPDNLLAPEEIRRGRRRFLLLVALFFGPLILSWVLVRYGAEHMDIEAHSYGELLTPVVTLETFEIEGDPGLTIDQLRGVWTLIYPLNGSCGEQCETVVTQTRQVRTALAKDMGRLQRVVIWANGSQQASLPLDDPARHPALTVIRGSTEQLQPLWGQLPGKVEEALYLVGPMGNVLMRYPLDFEGKPLLKELGFLLKSSVLG